MQDAKRQEHSFWEKIESNKKVEPKDWMPDAYRKSVIRALLNHINSEVIGMLPEKNWVTRAPSLRRKAALLAKIQDEAGHGLYLYSSAETLGISRPEMIESLQSGQSQYLFVFNYPTLTWADVGAIGWLVDGGAIGQQVPLQRTSYGPYARAMTRICKEESFHQRLGYDIMITLAKGSNEQKQMAQDALNRWWWPTLMMFGLPDTRTAHNDPLMKWKIKPETNDNIRQRFIDQTVPQIDYLGLEYPDPEIKWNEGRQHYDFGKIDWDEFYSVYNGSGHCNRDRIQQHKSAHQEGNWVREAMRKYREKHE